MPESLLEAYESYDPVIVQGCPISSLNIAEASIWLAAANMISLFDIGRAKDQGGQDIVPGAEYTSGFVRYVFVVPCAVT